MLYDKSVKGVVEPHETNALVLRLRLLLGFRPDDRRIGHLDAVVPGYRDFNIFFNPGFCEAFRVRGFEMAIYTQTGCKIEITGFNYNSGAIEIKYKTGHFDDVAIYELQADGGTEEIQETIKNLRGVVRLGG